MLPSALLTASASQPAEFSELNLHGLLPCCVRFASTRRPVNGNTRFRSVCSTVTGRDLHPLDSIKKFHRFISVPPLPSFSQRDNNVGGVKQFLSTLLRALEEERHFALVEDVPYPTKARSQSVFRSGTQSDPCISSITTSIMITSSNSSVRRSGTPNQLLGVLLHTMAISGLSRVRTELFHLLVVPSLAHHPVQLNG